MHKIEINKPDSFVVSSRKMAFGSIGIIDDPDFDAYNGKIVLAGYENIIGLDGEEWAKTSDIKVRILPAGTKITITVGE